MEHEQLVDRIYEAAVVPELWRSVLQDVTRVAEARHCVLIAARGESFNRWITSSPDFDELVIAHATRYPNNERTRRLVAGQHPGFVRDCDVITQEEIEREPVYRELLIPSGYGSGIGTLIAVPSGDNVIIHAERAYSQGSISIDALHRLDRLRPHFARAALASARLSMERAEGAVAALDVMGLPAAVLGPGGRAIAANQSLAALIPDVMQDRPSRLALVHEPADKLLTDAVAGLVRGPHDAAVRSIPIPARDERPPMIVHVMPIKGVAHDIFSHAVALLVATPIVPQEGPSATLIQGLFDLTPSEARLAAVVAGGHPPRHAAAQLGWTYETARTTLKRVMTKIGVERQGELIRLLAPGSSRTR